jgi:ribonuclease P protein component
LPGTGKTGFATAKKIGCHARRNSIRRKFQAAFREIPFQPTPKLDLVIIIGAGALGVKVADAKEELAAMLVKMEGRWAGE